MYLFRVLIGWLECLRLFWMNRVTIDQMESWLSFLSSMECWIYSNLIERCVSTREDERLGSGYPNSQTFLLFLFVLLARQLPLPVARITFFLVSRPFECNCCALSWLGCSVTLPVTFCLQTRAIFRPPPRDNPLVWVTLPPCKKEVSWIIKSLIWYPAFTVHCHSRAKSHAHSSLFQTPSLQSPYLLTPVR